MLFRIRYYIRIHILYLVRTDVPNCWLIKHAICPMYLVLSFQKYHSLKHLSFLTFPLILKSVSSDIGTYHNICHFTHSFILKTIFTYLVICLYRCSYTLDFLLKKPSFYSVIFSNISIFQILPLILKNIFSYIVSNSKKHLFRH